MSETTSEPTPFVFHTIDIDSHLEKVTTQDKIVENFRRDGMWVPVDYSIISRDIFFWSGGHPGSYTLIIDTPHTVTKEFTDRQHTWEKAALMDPVGEVYPPDSPLIPAYVKDIYERGRRVSQQKAQKGYYHVPPHEVRAVINWGNEGYKFEQKSKKALWKYQSGEETEFEVVKRIIDEAKTLNVHVNIFDPTLDTEKIYTKIAVTMTTLELDRRYEDLIQAIRDLGEEKLYNVNLYLSGTQYHTDEMDLAAFQDDKDEKHLITDRQTLRRYLLDAAGRLRQIKPSLQSTIEKKKMFNDQVFGLFHPQLAKHNTKATTS